MGNRKENKTDQLGSSRISLTKLAVVFNFLLSALKVITAKEELKIILKYKIGRFAMLIQVFIGMALVLSYMVGDTATPTETILLTLLCFICSIIGFNYIENNKAEK